MRKSMSVIVFIVLAFSVETAAWASQIVVPDTGSGIYTVQDGITAAVDGDEVVVEAGTYDGAINFSGKAITVRSATGPDVTFLESSTGFSLVVFDGGEGNGSVLRGFTIQSAGEHHGSGIKIIAASPVIEENIITENVAMLEGGGIRVQGGSPIIRNNTIRENKLTGYSPGGISYRGAGIYLSSSGTAEIMNNVIQGNGYLSCGVGFCMHGQGAGIYVRGGGNHRIIGNVITGNDAGWMFDENGGGIYITGTDGAIIANNTAYNNTAETGGVTGAGGGAGIYVAGDNTYLLLANNIVQENNGQGVLCETGAGVTLLTNALFGNTDGDLEDCPAGTGDLLVDAEMVDPAAGDFHLTETSPLVDMGTNGISGTPGEDIHGDSRLADGDRNGSVVIDMGADEVNPPPDPAWAAAATIGTDSVQRCRAAVNLIFLLAPLGGVLVWKALRRRH